MLDMICRKCDHLPLLYQLSVFKVFDKILSEEEPSKIEYKETVDFVRWVVREFFKLAMQSGCIFAEVTSWTKSHSKTTLHTRAHTNAHLHTPTHNYTRTHKQTHKLAAPTILHPPAHAPCHIEMRTLFVRLMIQAHGIQVMQK